MGELLPCPFCGGSASYQNDVGPNDEGFWEWIGCESCGAKADDTEAWNRRPSPPAEVAKVEARHYEQAYKNILAEDDYNSATCAYPSWKEIDRRAKALSEREGGK